MEAGSLPFSGLLHPAEGGFSLSPSGCGICETSGGGRAASIPVKPWIILGLVIGAGGTGRSMDVSTGSTTAGSLISGLASASAVGSIPSAAAMPARVSPSLAEVRGDHRDGFPHMDQDRVRDTRPAFRVRCFRHQDKDTGCARLPLPGSREFRLTPSFGCAHLFVRAAR